MRKDDIYKIISSGETTNVTIDPDIKTEITKKQIDGIVSEMKKHILKKKRVHIILVRE